MMPPRTTSSRKIQTVWLAGMIRGRTVGPMISLMYTTLMARYPPIPRVLPIDSRASAG